jgi:hypothetical protein
MQNLLRQIFHIGNIDEVLYSTFSSAVLVGSAAVRGCLPPWHDAAKELGS